MTCPCGLGPSYGRCCGPLHRGRRAGEPTAPTAERLMRSRYSAFAMGDAEYLSATWLPATRPAEIELDPQLRWERLDVRGTTGGDEDDTRGTVDFVAHFWDENGHRDELHEHSAFVREDGQWFYVGPLGTTPHR